MTIDRDAIAELFAAFGPVLVRPMFGGAGIYADGVFFALITDGVIYLKGNDETAARFESEGCRRFTYRTRARMVETNLWRMPERLYDDPDELADWARQAHGVAVRSRMKKPRRKPAVAAPKTKKPVQRAKRPAKRPATRPAKQRVKRLVKRPGRSGPAGIRGRSRK